MTPDIPSMDAVHTVIEIADMQKTIAEILSILNAPYFDANLAREKIREVNNRHPDNLSVYNMVYPPVGEPIPLDQANWNCLAQDLEWKAYYLNAKCCGKTIDMIKRERLGGN